MQFYPATSKEEEQVHPALYKRREGIVDFSTLSGSGFGYRLQKIEREMPQPAAK